MQKNSIFEFCKDSHQDTVSIWEFPKEKKRPIFIVQELETMPRLDSNATYYQDYYKKTKFYRAIPFPKILIFELINFQQEYQKYNIRVYEKSDIESKIQSSLIYFYIEGKYYKQSDHQQIEPNSQSLEAKDELDEEIMKIEVLFGSRVNFVLRQFAKKVLIDFKRNYKDVQINDVQQKGETLDEFWQKIEDQAQYLNSEVDHQWPCEDNVIKSQKFQYPYQITNWDWKKKENKDEFQQFSDDMNVMYEIENEYKVMFQKKEVEFDYRNIHLFRVSLQGEESQLLKRIELLDGASKPMGFSQNYQISFQQLSIDQINNSMLGNTQIYLIYTPFSLFLWFGSEVKKEKRVGALPIFKSFMTMNLDEYINFQPSYLHKSQNMKTLKFRIETQHYESQRFRALFKKAWAEDKLDYIMMRKPKLYNPNDYLKDDVVEDLKQQDLDPDFMHDKKKNHSSNAEEKKFMRQKTFEKDNLSQSTLMKSTTIKSSTLKGLKGLNREQHKFDQDKFLSDIKAIFDPTCILQGGTLMEESKGNKNRQSSPIGKNVNEFDQISIFEMKGNIFEPMYKEFDYGIFDKRKQYFIVFTKNLMGSKYTVKHTIYMWRGSDSSQSSKVLKTSLLTAMNKFQETEFRSIQAQMSGNTDLKRRSSMTHMSSFHRNLTQNTIQEDEKSEESDEFEKDDELVMQQSKVSSRRGTVLQQKQLYNKMILTPSAVTQFTSQDKLDGQKILNMKPIIDLDKSIISMRSIIKQDNEPQHFLQAFEGTIIIRSNDYLTRQFQDEFESIQESSGINYVMVFQLIGIPTLNQKAREVPPEYSSFTTTGVYILLTKFQIHFWIGQEFFNDYLDESNYNKMDSLISQSLRDKLYYLYEFACEGPLYEQKIVFNIESREDKSFFKIIGFDSDDWDNFDQRDILKFESKFIKEMVIPQEPRLYCLVINGNIVDYDEEVVSQFSNEKIVIINKEIHNFSQKSLDNKGVFLLDFYSEAFIWIGKKVKNEDRLYVLQHAYSALKVLHNDEKHLDKMCISQVDGGFEPEIFKSAFKDGWQNFEHDLNIELEDTDEEQGLDMTQDIKSPRRLTQLDTSFRELVPETIWYV